MFPLLRRNNFRVVLAGMVFAGILIPFIESCKKEEKEERILTTRDNLLGTWRRQLRGYDSNLNGILDSSEYIFNAGSDTFSVTLVPDATYTRVLRNKGNDIPERGTWHLQKNDIELVFQPSTSSTPVDTFRLDSVSQLYFSYHNSKRYYEAFVRPN